MVVVFLILHGLLAAALLGALTHQALAATVGPAPPGPRSFLSRFARVNGAAYVNPVIVIYVLTAIGGCLVYPLYRLDVRPMLEDAEMVFANGFFEIKEHLISLGLGILPAYWFAWKQPVEAGYVPARRYLTWMLAFFGWWGLIVGHVLNNIKGLNP